MGRKFVVYESPYRFLITTNDKEGLLQQEYDLERKYPDNPEHWCVKKHPSEIFYRTELDSNAFGVHVAFPGFHWRVVQDAK